MSFIEIQKTQAMNEMLLANRRKPARNEQNELKSKLS